MNYVDLEFRRELLATAAVARVSLVPCRLDVTLVSVGPGVWAVETGASGDEVKSSGNDAEANGNTIGVKDTAMDGGPEPSGKGEPHVLYPFHSRPFPLL